MPQENKPDHMFKLLKFIEAKYYISLEPQSHHNSHQSTDNAQKNTLYLAAQYL